MDFWQHINKDIEEKNKGIFMCVLESKGSSPGRQGFKMYVSSTGDMKGSIGGGIMEYKLVEYCKTILTSNDVKPFLKRQIHQDNIKKNKSGMICSGEQLIGFFPLSKNELVTIKIIIENNARGLLKLSENGIKFDGKHVSTIQYQLAVIDDDHWRYEEQLDIKPLLQIIGGGHVSLALSRLAISLGFMVHQYDDRKNLNTMAKLPTVENSIIEDYGHINQAIIQDQNSYVVIMSFGYQSDKIILKQLLHANFKYLGMMGSKEKIKRLFKDLNEEGFTLKALHSIHAPIGLSINSKTPEEIAVSIMGEIISVKNR